MTFDPILIALLTAFVAVLAVIAFRSYRQRLTNFVNRFLGLATGEGIFVAGRSVTAGAYTPLWRIPGNKNFQWLVIGLMASILIGVVVALFFVALIYWLMPVGQPAVVYLAAVALGGFLGYEVAQPVFTKGRFTVKPGQTAYRSVLDVPFDQMELGQTWQVPGLMTEKIVDSQAFPVVNQPELFITGNGVNVEAQMSCTPFVADPLKHQKLKPGQAETVTGRLLSNMTRAYISTKYVELEKIGDLEGLAPAEQWKFVQKMIGFKGDIAQNGPEEIRVLLNEQLADYGLEVEEGQVQVNRLSLPKIVENAIDELFKEIFEKISKTNDIRTKSAVAGILGETFKTAGVNFKKLSQAQLLDLVGANLDRALANEGVANIYAFHSRGGNAPGIMLNPNSTTKH
ncbi:MAG: hypothetical protein G01um101456_92 [Parcubacteria group bacterium Gr01-1014_56]|nr:MAG: hypothetical protein G01um101456_92 [Parcubacteria group bacterium Gr01-1014_56]